MLPDQWTIANWPTNSTNAAYALNDMVSTHRIIPLPAYSTDNKLINPNDYKLRLMGALVRIEFTLSHWLINRNNKAPLHTFVADIMEIRVLDSPKPIESPKRKRVRATVESDSDSADDRLKKKGKEKDVDEDA